MNKYILPIIFGGALLLRCGFEPLAGGSTDTELGSVVAGRAVLENGLPAAAVHIRIRPVEYVHAPGESGKKPMVFDAITDASGHFSVSGIRPGGYTVEANDEETSAALVTADIKGDDTIVDIGTVGLKPYARITGVISAVSGASAPFQFVQVRGLERFERVGLDGAFAIVDLPEGRFDLRFVAADTTVTPAEISGINVKSDIMVSVSVPGGWRYGHRIYLNTAASGANVAGNVTGFPVLLRFTEDKFNFNQALAGGADLRFEKPNGAPLPYEVERWDPVIGRAEVWVRMDTVFGNDSMQSLTMYWGNASAEARSDPASVFDTGSGFQGVWHLGATDSLSPDATRNQYNGIGRNTSSVAGMIGKARHFNGTSSAIQMKGTSNSRLSYPMNGRYTLSAWVFHDTLADSVTYLIAGKGELQYFIKTFGLAQSTPQHIHHWEFTEYHGNDIWQAATFSPAKAKTWTYLVGIRDGSNQYLYVNGTPAMEGYRVFGTGQTTIPRDTTDDFAIGAFLHQVIVWDQGHAYFRGAIDEVTVSNRSRSADWIKLSFMNQKEQDVLIKW